MHNTIQRAIHIDKVYAQLTFLWEEKVCVYIHTLSRVLNKVKEKAL